MTNSELKQSNIKTLQRVRRYDHSKFDDIKMAGISTSIQGKEYLRKLLKMLLLAFSLVGFFYQTYEFLQLYMRYSTVESETVGDLIMKPAFTICDENLVRRDFVCAELPEVCAFLYNDTREGYCKKYPKICERMGNVLKSLLPMEILPDSKFDLDFTKRSGFRLNESLVSCEWRIQDGSGEIRTDCGVAKFVRGMTENGYPATCYVFGSHIGDKNYIAEYFKHAVLLLKMKWKEGNNLPKKRTYYYYYLWFHHPGELINPFPKRFSLSSNRYYKLNIRQKTVLRLPAPYDTHCKDYEKEWIKNGGRGPLNKEDCKSNCDIEEQLKEYGCVNKEIIKPHEEKLCVSRIKSASFFNQKIRKCKEKCADACSRITYDFKSEIMEQISGSEALKNYGSTKAVIFEINFHNTDSDVIKYTPKYENIQLFSYFGGYLGMWLGWSIIALVEFIPMTVNLFKSLLKKRRNKNKVKPFTLRYL